MKCPKCGAVQADGLLECTSCGVVFARWQPIPTRTRPGTPIPRPPSTQPIPIAFIAIAALLILLAGLVWNKHRQAVRAAEKPEDALNALNNAQIAQMKQRAKRIQQESAARAPTPAPAAVAFTLPADLNESTMRSMLDRCSFFGDSVIVNLPRSFRANLWQWTRERYPALPLAVIQGYAHYDPAFDSSRVPRGAPDPVNPGDTINVILTAPPVLRPVEASDEYHLDLGRRHIDTIKPFEVASDAVRVMLTWSLEEPLGVSLTPEQSDQKGTAYFQKYNGQWSVAAWRTTSRESFQICH